MPTNLSSGAASGAPLSPRGPFRFVTPSAPATWTAKRNWAVVLLLALLFHISTVSPHHPWGDDFAQYILHARNIATGVPYADTGYLINPIDPSRLEVGPHSYPVLMPLLLSPVYRWFGPSFEPMKYVQAGLLVVAAWLSMLYCFSTGRLDSSQGTLYLCVIAFLPLLWETKEYIGADLLFLALVFACLLLLELIVNRPQLPKWMVALAGTCFFLAYAARTVGIVLIPVTLVLSYLQRRRRGSLLLAAGVGVALAIAQSIWWASDDTYLRLLWGQTSLRAILYNAVNYGKELSGVWKTNLSPVAAQSLFLISLPVAAWGAYCFVRKQICALDVFALGYLSVILIWPSFQGTRFLVPLLPVYLVYLFGGSAKLGKQGPSILTAALLLIFGVNYVSRYTSPEEVNGFDQPEFAELARVIDKISQPEDRFLFAKPRALALIANRAAAVYNSTRNDEKSWELVQQLKIRYIVKATLPGEDFAPDRTILQPFLEAYSEDIELVYANERFALYKVLKMP